MTSLGCRGLRLDTVSRLGPALLAAVVVIGCASSRPAAAPPPPRPGAMPDFSNMVPQRARTVYRAMGLMVDSSRLSFVGSVRFLAGPTPDSTLVMFAMSLANRALNFRRDSNALVADYHVELTLRHDSGLVHQVARDEKVRVGSVPETLRRDESIIFQQVLTLPPGTYNVSVVVRDLSSPAYAQVQMLDTVPQFDSSGLGRPLPIYEGAGRNARRLPPALVANPRGTTGYGEPARVYVEGYGFARGTRVAARVVDLDSVEMWHDTLALGEGPLASVQFVIKPGVLPPGRVQFQAQAVGAATRVSVPLLVTFSDVWAVNGFDQVVDLLRFFSGQDLVAKLKAAPRAQRAAAWQEFYRASDPTPATPQNEPIDKYFHRVDVANQRYPEAKDPGWKTDRGEVYITLGEPDQAFEVPGKYAPGLRWEYSSYHTTLAFQDNEGLGQYRLTAQSRADFEHTVAEARAAK